jgi:hypothetical protein
LETSSIAGASLETALLQGGGGGGVIHPDHLRHHHALVDDLLLVAAAHHHDRDDDADHQHQDAGGHGHDPPREGLLLDRRLGDGRDGDRGHRALGAVVVGIVDVGGPQLDPMLAGRRRGGILATTVTVWVSPAATGRSGSPWTEYHSALPLPWI